jgi:hypothetical protein
MFNKKRKEKKDVYKVIFCDTNDYATKFHTYTTCESDAQADYIIRMGWNKKRSDRVGNGYKVKDSWILIEKN